MKAGKLYRAVKALGKSEKAIWRTRILSSMEADSEAMAKVPFEDLVLIVYACFDKTYYMPDRKAIGYGAGKMAHKYIPCLRERLDFYEIWDAYADVENICGIPVVRPETKTRSFDVPIIVFIDDKISRYDVIGRYTQKGYDNVFYFRDYRKLLKNFAAFPEVKKYAADTAKEIIDEFYRQYELIEGPYLPVLFPVLKKDLAEKKVQNDYPDFHESILKERLSKKITVNRIPENRWNEAMSILVQAKPENMFQMAYDIEIILQNLLANGVKTLERSMRMADDRPYDGFAVTEVVNEVLGYLLEDDEKVLDVIHTFRSLAEDSVSLMASECCFQMTCGQYGEALDTARHAMKKEPNSLLANEMFYQAACACKQKGIHVEEPIPAYDLSERFCWSGLNFVWCGGFDSQTGLAEFSPCFRPLQCAARPEGEFWSGEDWKEFRRSVTDGSFRYCQKNQCANIVAGWLPRKKDYQEGWIRKILDGDLSVIPPIEELHFSYDGHCNLKCPSCRLEIQTNTPKQNAKLDELYERNLKPYMGEARHLTLSGCGEAMISPHSKKVLQSFSRKENPELAVELRTNATTVNPVSWNSLGTGKEVIRHITVSIDAATKESFEKLRRPAKWETVLRNLEFIQSLRNSGEIELFEFHVVIQKENISQLCDIAKMAVHYDADAVTYSRLINWREMPEEEYHEVNPFWYDHPQHETLVRELRALEELRNDMETGRSALTKGRKKIYINIHFSPDPDASYDVIRKGRLKIR